MPACPGGRWVLYGPNCWPLVSIGRALGIFGFIRFRLVHSGAPWRSSGSFGLALAVVGYIPARLGSRSDHSDWWGSFARGSSGSVGLARGVVGVLCVYSGPSLGSFGRPLEVISVHLGSLSTFGSSLGVAGIFWVRWVHLRAPCGSPGSLWFVAYIRALSGVVAIILVCRVHSRAARRVQLGSPVESLVFFVFIRSHRRVHSAAPLRSLAFIWVRWVHSVASLGL